MERKHMADRTAYVPKQQANSKLAIIRDEPFMMVVYISRKKVLRHQPRVMVFTQ